MTYARRPAQGTVVKFESASVDVAIPGLLKVVPPSTEPIVKDTTGYEDAATRTTGVGVMKNSGFSIEGDFDPKDTAHSALLTKVMAGDKINITIVYPTATGMTDEFSCYLKLAPGTDLKGMTTWKLDVAGDIDGAVTRTIT